MSLPGGRGLTGRPSLPLTQTPAHPPRTNTCSTGPRRGHAPARLRGAGHGAGTGGRGGGPAGAQPRGDAGTCAAVWLVDSMWGRTGLELESGGTMRSRNARTNVRRRRWFGSCAHLSRGSQQRTHSIAYTHHHHPQPHDAAAENGYLELANFLRGLCGLEALERLPDEDEDGAGGIVVDMAGMGDDCPNQQDPQEEEEPMAE